MPIPAVVIAVGAAIASVALSLLLMPRPKPPKPDEVKQLDDPVAEIGKPLPVVFGTVTIKELNVLHFSDKRVQTFLERA